MPRLHFALLTAVLAASSAVAQDAPPGVEEYFMPETDESLMQESAPSSAMPEAETQTGRWLRLQGSGAMAGSKYTIPGQIATLSYRRYLNSFRYPIPRQFSFGGGMTSGTTGGGGGGMSGGGGMGGGSGVMPY